MAAPSHALLSASSAKRWLNCPPSARLNDEVEDITSDFAAEGTDAHTLCEFKLRNALGLTRETQMPKLGWYNAEMEECANNYVAYVQETIADIKKTCPDPVVLIEQRLDFSRYVPEGFGTGDCVIVADDVLHVIDYKHGRGVPVYAEDNPQMMLYALGALEIFDFLYDIKRVVMTIYQPRISNISTAEMASADLHAWAETELAPIAKLAYEGKGDFKTGDHCRFCKIKAVCRARADANLKLASEEFKPPALLDTAEIEAILEQVDDLVAWANDIKQYALEAALKGKQWTNWKVVAGRSNRKFSDEDAVARAVVGAGLDPYEQKLLSVSELQRKIGKAPFSELVEQYVVKPPGKPTLVPRSDNREELNSAAADFKNE